MRTQLLLIVVGGCICGCSHPRVAARPTLCESAQVSTQPRKLPESRDELQRLMLAASELSGDRRVQPKPIQQLQPIAVYDHLANVVIALERDDAEERGYYIVRAISSFDPGFYCPESFLGSWSWSSLYSGWRWKPIEKEMGIYEYVFKR